MRLSSACWPRLILGCCLALVAGGCAAHGMALRKGQDRIDPGKGAIVLLSIRTTNELDPKSEIDVIGLIVCPAAEPCTNPRPYLYKADGPFRREKGRFQEYLLSLALAPGAYVIDSVGLLHQTFFTAGGGYTPLRLAVEVRAGTVGYLGHMDVVLRRKTSEAERTAGREQVDLAVVRVERKGEGGAGFAAGTTDVRIEDRFDEDMGSFASRYPGLRGVRVEKALLGPWIRPAGQGR
jgi:hypothetical protein